MRAVASLTRLSPSSTTIKRRGTPRRWKIAVAATASVGETMAPSAKQAGHDNGTAVRAGAQGATIATTQVGGSTKPAASSTIAAKFARNPRAGEFGAAGDKEGGGRRSKPTLR